MDNPVDTRLEYVGKYVTKSLRLKPDKWGRLLAVDEQRDQVLEFLNRPDLTVMLVLQNTAATLAIVTGFPASIKSKAVYFIKKKAQAVTKDNMEDLLIPGDIAPKAIEHLACLVEEVFVPILSNPDNHTTWPAAVAQDIHMHVHGLKSTVYQVKGQVTGQTVLAMPVGVERVDQAERDLIRSKGEIVDLYLKSAIEGVIIKWATQINDVITEDSAQAFANGNNPVPYEEVAFWDARLRNLRYIYRQLRDERVRKMAVILEKTDSAYFPCFKTLFRNIVAALAEAQDISLYLKPLLRHFKVVEETDFSELSPHLMPLVHVVCLVWSNSRYYCTSSKIIILLRQICNLLIQQAKKYLDPSSIFQSDVMEAKERIKDVVTTLTMFRKVFDNRREKIATYFEDREPVLWNFHPNMVFERFNAFLARLATIETFFDTVTEFMKLEKVEVGGLQGRALSAQIGGVFADFSELLLRFAAKAGDALAPEDGAFARDYAAFQRRVEHLDRRLAALFCLAFDDCSNLESIFKLIEIVGTVLDRPLIEREFTAKYAQVLDRLDQDVAVSEELYEEQMREYSRSGSMPVDVHMPPVAGAMRWARMLARRDAFSVQRFRELNHPVATCARAKAVLARHERLLAQLEAFEERAFVEWAAALPEQVERNLRKPLLARVPSARGAGALLLNFDPELSAMIREVHYLKLMGRAHIPPEALAMYERGKTFRKYTDNLGQTVLWYNQVRRSSRSVEYELVKEQVEEIDALVEKGQSALMWNSEGLWEYIERLHGLVHDLEKRLAKTQSNVEAVRALLGAWHRVALFERRDGRKDALLCLDDRRDRTAKRYAEISSGAAQIQELLKENQRLFGLAAPEGAPEGVKGWRDYVDFVDALVGEAVLRTVGCSGVHTFCGSYNAKDEAKIERIHR